MNKKYAITIMLSLITGMGFSSVGCGADPVALTQNAKKSKESVAAAQKQMQSFQEKIKRILQVEDNEFYRETLLAIAEHDIGGHDFSLDNTLYTAILPSGSSHLGKLYIISDTELFSFEEFGRVTGIETASENKMIQPHQVIVYGTAGGTGESHNIAYVLEKTKEGIKSTFSYPIQGYSVQNFSAVPNVYYTVEPLYLDKSGEAKFKILLKTFDNYLDPTNADTILNEYGFDKPEQVFFLTIKRQDSKKKYQVFDASDQPLNSPPKAFSLIDSLWGPSNAVKK